VVVANGGARTRGRKAVSAVVGGAAATSVEELAKLPVGAGASVQDSGEAPEQAMMKITPLPAARILVPIIGATPLIVHKWDEKSKIKMLNEMQGKKEPKKPKDPVAEYKATLYHTDEGGYGFPTVGFKACIVSAARFYDKSVTMVRLRQCLFMQGVASDDGKQILTPIIGLPAMREDAVTVGMKGRDLRYRAEFQQWSAVLDITYITSALDGDSVLSLVDAAGRGVGVGEWRPEKSGQNGTFRVDQDRPVQRVSE
jgi:hypothetical protein